MGTNLTNKMYFISCMDVIHTHHNRHQNKVGVREMETKIDTTSL